MESKNKPYLITTKEVFVRSYNPDFGDDKVCVCGHKYYRHFDTYDDMDPVGGKYCQCYTFQEAKKSS